jgi:hypothetical protein
VQGSYTGAEHVKSLFLAIMLRLKWLPLGKPLPKGIPWSSTGLAATAGNASSSSIINVTPEIILCFILPPFQKKT